MNKTVIIRSFLLGLCLLSSVSAFSDMVLNKMVLDFSAEGVRRDDVSVYNSGDKRLYLVVQAEKVVSPGMKAEHREAYHNPKELGLLVTPKRMILEPKQRRLIRIVAINPPSKQEFIYRITIKPVSGKIKTTQTMINVVVGYELLVILRPIQAKSDLKVLRQAKKILFHNQGNTNVLLSRGEQCDENAQNCQTLPVKRVYPGAKWQVDLPYRDTPVRYYLQTVGKNTIQQF